LSQNRIKTETLEPQLAALYGELGSIAKQPSPLDEANLVTREHLLKCEAVAQLVAAAGHDAKPRAAYVAIAIEQAIGRIESGENRDIAEAMFALVSPAYKGQSVRERKKLLKTDRQIPTSKWDDRRRHVLLAVATQLRNPPATPSPTLTRSRLTPKIAPVFGVELQARQAAILHSAGLATLFVRHFDQVLHGSHAPLRTPSQAYFFNSYIALMYGPWFATQQTQTGLSIHQAYDANLSKTTVDRVDGLVQILDEHSPIGPTRNMDNSAVRVLHFFAQIRAAIPFGNIDLLVFNELLPSVDAHLWVDQDGELMDQTLVPSLMSVYETWVHWLGSQLAQSDGEKNGGIGHITRASGSLAEVLGSTPAMQSVARTLAHKAIGSYYEMPEWELLGDGKSLKQYADAFFEQSIANSREV